MLAWPGPGQTRKKRKMSVLPIDPETHFNIGDKGLTRPQQTLENKQDQRH